MSRRRRKRRGLLGSAHSTRDPALGETVVERVRMRNAVAVEKGEEAFVHDALRVNVDVLLALT